MFALIQHAIHRGSTRFQVLVASGCALLLGGASLVLPPLVVLGGMLLIPVALLALKRPELLLLVFLTISATIFDQDQNPSVSAGVGTLYLTDIVLLALFGLIIVRWMIEPDFKLIHTPLDWPIFLLFAFVCVATLKAIVLGTLPFKQSLDEMRIVSGYLLFFAVTNVLRERRQLTLLIQGMLFLATIVAIAMMLQYMLGNRVAILPGRVEALSTEGENFQGITRILPPGQSLILTGFILLVILLIVTRFRLVHSWYFGQLVLISIALLLTFNRNFWVGAALAVLMIIYFVDKAEYHRLIGWASFTLVLVGIALVLVSSMPDSKATTLLAAFQDRLFSLFESDTYQSHDSSLRWRDFEYAHAWPQIASHPLLGLGMGAKYRPFIPDFDHALYDGRAYIHNGHIWMMLKGGLLSYACLVWFSVVFLLRGLTRWQAVRDPAFRACILAFCLTYISVLLGSIVNSMLMQWYWTPLIGIMMGINETIFRWSAADEKSGWRN